MTTEEHKLMMFMFARLYELVGATSEALVKCGAWSGPDLAAFQQMVHDDNSKFAGYAEEAMSDYLRCAKDAGVVTGIEPGPPD
jgi:hypothetical protein